MNYFKNVLKKEKPPDELDAFSDNDEVEIQGSLKPAAPTGTRFKPMFVIIAASLLLVMLTYVITVGLEEPEEKSKNEEEFRKKQVTLGSGHINNDELSSLPDNYGDLKNNKDPREKPVIITPQQTPQQPNRIANRPAPMMPQTQPSRLVNSPMIGRFQISDEEKERLSALKSAISFGLGNDTNKQNQVGNGGGGTDGVRSNETTSQGNSFYTKSQIQKASSQFEVKAGTIIPGVLITGINSDLPGQIVGQVRENVYDYVTGNYLLIPNGSRLIGTYSSNVAYAQDRLLVTWNRIIFPNGDSLDLEGMPGADSGGYSGFHDKTNNHIPRILNGVLLGSILTAGARVATGGIEDRMSYSQLVGAGAAENVLQATTRITEKNLNIPPTIEISPGYRFNVFVTKDIVLSPYSG